MAGALLRSCPVSAGDMVDERIASASWLIFGCATTRLLSLDRGQTQLSAPL